MENSNDIGKTSFGFTSNQGNGNGSGTGIGAGTGKDFWSGFTNVEFPFTSSATPPTCDETCKTCADQFRPQWSRNDRAGIQMHMRNDDDAAAEIKKLVESTNENHGYIRERIEVYGNAIAKRWQNRNLAKRKLLLQTAKPNMAAQKRANLHWLNEDYENIKKFDKLKRMGRVPTLEEYEEKEKKREETHLNLIPYLDAETLSEDPMRLLALMHHRSHAEQSEWILFDCEQFKANFHAGRVRLEYNPHCVITYGENLGTLTQWNKDTAHRWDVIGYPCAFLIFKAQHVISDLLRKMIDLLLERGLDKASQGRQLWDSLVATNFTQPRHSMAELPHWDQAFSAPPSFDAQRMVDSFEVRREATVDEMCSMQSDPAYVRKMLEELEAGPYWSQYKEEDKEEQLFMVPLLSVMRYHFWDYIRMQAEAFVDTQNKYRDEIRVGSSLPEEYDTELTELETTLKASFHTIVTNLGCLVAELPAFRQHFSLNPSGQVQINTSKQALFSTDQLFWNLAQLNGYDNEFARPPSFHLAFIDELLSQDSGKRRARIDQVVYDLLSDLAAVDEALCAVRYHRGHEELPLKSKKGREITERAMSNRFTARITSCLRTHQAHHGPLWNAIREFKDLPMPGRKISRATLTRNKDLHDGLAHFWEVVRTQLKVAMKQMKLNDHPVAQDVMAPVSMLLPESCRESFEKEQEEIRRVIEKQERDQEARKKQQTKDVDPSKYIPILAEAKKEPILVRTPPKPKLKSRPLTAADPEPDDSIQPLAIDDDSPAHTTQKGIDVSDRSICLFSRMFSSFESLRGLTRWEDFVAAMADAGCSATHNGGSAVTFVDERNNCGSIVVHRPHPDPNLDPIKLRAIGKRLGRRFGWDAETFVDRKGKA